MVVIPVSVIVLPMCAIAFSPRLQPNPSQSLKKTLIEKYPQQNRANPRQPYSKITLAKFCP